MTVEIERVRFAVFVVLIAAAGVAAQPFDRYQTVIDRKPFGPEPVNFDPEAAPGSASANAAAGGGEMTEEQRTAEEQQLAASVRVSMINITPAGDVAVGFTDSSVNPVENYYLRVGRSQNGWTVKSADPATESVTLEKGGVDVTVKLGETSGGGKANGSKRGRGFRSMTLQAGDGPAVAAHAGSEAPAAQGFGRAPLGGLARLRQRRAEMQAMAQAEAAKKAQAAAVAAAEREEREAREAEEKRAQEEQKAREAEERAQQREALRQIQEQLRKEREAREAAQQQEEQNQEVQGDANNVE